MTRKLSPLKQLLGARAGWQGASKLARPRAMHAPVGDAIDGDEMCAGGCGFRFCAKRGPCAPPASIDWPAPVAAPQPAGAPLKPGQSARFVHDSGDIKAGHVDTIRACREGCGGAAHYHVESVYGRINPEHVEPAGARFVVGQRVRIVREGRSAFADEAIGRSASIATIEGDDVVLDVDGFRKQYGYTEDLEPLPSETPERGDWVPPAPWQRCVDTRGEAYAYGGDRYYADVPLVAANEDGVTWYAMNREAEVIADAIASPALACCAALSIDLRPCSCITPSCTNHAAYLPGESAKLAFGADTETCARLALAAHARLVSR